MLSLSLFCAWLGDILVLKLNMKNILIFLSSLIYIPLSNGCKCYVKYDRIKNAAVFDITCLGVPVCSLSFRSIGKRVLLYDGISFSYPLPSDLRAQLYPNVGKLRFCDLRLMFSFIDMYTWPTHRFLILTAK